MCVRKSILRWGQLAVLLIKILIKIHLTFCGAINTKPMASPSRAAAAEFSNVKIYAKNSKILVNKILPQTHTPTHTRCELNEFVCVCESFKPKTLAKQERKWERERE